MSFFDTMVNSPFAGAVGWMLLHSLWQGAIVSAVLAAGLLMVRSPRVRYAAACGAMLMMLGSAIVTLIAVLPGGGYPLRTVTRPPSTVWHWVRIASAPDVWTPSMAAVAPWLAPFWIAGVLIFALRHVVGFASLEQLRRRGVCCAPQRWQEELSHCVARLRVSRSVLLLESCLADTPMVLGYFRPLILMPVGLFAGLPAAQIKAILLHELAHIRRHDYLVNVLQRVVEALLFYHPAVWWISHIIRAERENCCDDTVVSISGDVHGYACALVALEQTRWHGRELALAATGGSLVKRIRRLLYPAGPNPAWTPFLAVVVLLATAAATMAAWHPAPTAMQSDSSSADPYVKWLNEDVVYIIDDAERSAFQNLTTNEERDKFIEQFWERRNPTPGASGNEFKEEHYRRIDFANRHFGTATLAGWQTDRGHIYIVNGPPDEIDSHPAGAGRAVGKEQWRYLNAKDVGDNGVVTFVDQKGNGEYQLAAGKAH